MSRDNHQRITTSPINRYCEDLLRVACGLNKRSQALQASIFLTEGILAQEEAIKKQVQYLADESGLTYEEMWQSLKNSNL